MLSTMGTLPFQEEVGDREVVALSMGFNGVWKQRLCQKPTALAGGTAAKH